MGERGNAEADAVDTVKAGSLSALLAWCEARSYRSRGTNPTRGVERFPEPERERDFGR